MAAQTDRGIPLSALCPKFLHTNSTSHTWPFSAVAELIDNAYDPDVKARQFWIDKTKVKGHDCLTFMDNGAGIDYDKMHKMLSFGFSDKQTINGHVPVGLYGNGFKSGSMRLGKDAIVFSKKGDSMCVGMLSQTYLQNTGAENVVVPIVTFRPAGSGNILINRGNSIIPMAGHEASLQDILQHSLFQTMEELISELKAINSPPSTNTSGTRIIIWNLRKTSDGKLEFDFESDRYDIRIPAEVYENTKDQIKRLDFSGQLVPDSVCSLRAYCSILYLKPRMLIVIRGQKVKTQLVSKTLAHRLKDTYKPLFLPRPLKITFGYNTKSKEHYGLMMYHKNRLIKAYERVGCQLKANRTGVGIIGVIECDFLQPTHNKQDFDATDEYRKTLYNVGIKLEDYWKEVHHRLRSTVPVEDIQKRPDQNWVQCNSCLKWRKLPDGIDTDKLPESWFCHMNYDPQFRSCTVEQEQEDSDDEQTRYQNTYKQHEKKKKLQEDRYRQQVEQQKKKAEQEKKKEEEQRMAALQRKNVELLQKQQDLERQLRRSAPSTPRTPAQSTPNSSLTASPLTRAGSRPSDIMPVISEVISLSTATPSRIKRGLEMGRGRGEAKKARTINNLFNNMPDSPSTSTASPKSCSSPVMIIHDGEEAAQENDDVCDDIENDDDDDDDDNNDDDIMIVESSSTPRPKPATLDLSKVKTERRLSEDQPELRMECNDDAAIDNSTTTEATDLANSSPPDKVSITTQTEREQAVKKEEENSGEQREQNDKKDRGSTKQGAAPAERRTNEGQEASGSIQEPPGDQVRRVTRLENGNGEANQVKSEGDPPLDSLSSESQNLSVLEAQEQQDNLLELLEVASRERDESRAQAQLLTSQVEELQSSLHELTEKMLKKEQCQQSTQTDAKQEEEKEGEGEDKQDYKALYLQATENTQQLQCKLDNMKKEAVEKEVQADVENSSSSVNQTSRDVSAGVSTFDGLDDDLACQIDHLMRELDEKNKAQEDLKNKLDDLEHQKSTLSTYCENLRKDLEEIRSQSEEVKVNQEERETQTEAAAAAGPSNQESISASGSNQTERQISGGEDNAKSSVRLRELRQKVGRLLVTFVPALDLEQVNYDCDVIDEILNQVVEEIFGANAAS
ncbi:MORC family CW-type zinc finger protein 3a [Astyanax mexicanus]|uniref:MORC family CW-type zinc finger protein 3a n=1 Tax=Astyanax mexicanus TaxID=7994 RepID=UPI0020CB47E0|nr:MORC family CW-type zinc finger protein 3a [Astyanax mexicanus]